MQLEPIPEERVRGILRLVRALYALFVGVCGATPVVDTLLDIEVDMEDKNLVDVTSYNIVIDTWSKCKSNDGVHEVDKLLKRMLEIDDDRVTPDVVTFNAILDTCSNVHSNVNTIATNVEQKVEDMYGIMQSLQIKPNVRTYNLLISSYSKSIANHLEIGRVSGRQNNNNNGVLVNK